MFSFLYWPVVEILHFITSEKYDLKWESFRPLFGGIVQFFHSLLLCYKFFLINHHWTVLLSLFRLNIQFFSESHRRCHELRISNLVRYIRLPLNLFCLVLLELYSRDRVGLDLTCRELWSSLLWLVYRSMSQTTVLSIVYPTDPDASSHYFWGHQSRLSTKTSKRYCSCQYWPFEVSVQAIEHC